MSSENAAHRRVTLDTIALTAGTSKATVSKALNGREDISSATRERILKIAEDLGYARRSHATEPRHVALVADAYQSVYTMQVLRGAARECATHGYLLTATHLEIQTQNPATQPLTREWLTEIAQTHIGLALVTCAVPDSLVRTCADLELPLVAIDPTNHPRSDVLTFGSTNWNGGLEATRHLLDLGHTRIAYVRGPADSLPSIERLQGYLSALQMAGISAIPDLVTGKEFTFEGGLEAGRQLFALPSSRRPTAVFAGSDWLALGVMEAARQAGLDVPGDISVVGFDDTEVAASTSPGLTSVHQQIAQLGAAAVRALVDIHRGHKPTGPMRLTTWLVRRSSTAPPSSRSPKDATGSGDSA